MQLEQHVAVPWPVAVLHVVEPLKPLLGLAVEHTGRVERHVAASKSFLASDHLVHLDRRWSGAARLLEQQLNHLGQQFELGQLYWLPVAVSSTEHRQAGSQPPSQPPPDR